jgi:hypothetical protein
MRAMCDRDRLQPRVSPDGAQEESYVVAHRFRAELQLFGNLACRTAAFEKLEHLRLPWREVQVRMRVRLLDQV